MALPRDGEEIIQRYTSAINEFAEDLLRPFLSQLDLTRYGSRKELNDPIWGTVIVRPPELLIVDSPIFQRLRRIRQLGVVHLVYPAAVHTRFEHSIGVLHQVAELIRAINQCAHSEAKRLAIDKENEQLLRLTALFHDVGHGLMSHVSENALANLPEVNDLQRAFSDKYSVENPALSELAAFFIVKSPAVNELLQNAWKQSGEQYPQVPIEEFISRAIVGLSVSTELPLLHEIITGPYDADKLDYLARDSYMSGVPQVVDINRLSQKIRVAVLTAANLPEEIANEADGKQPNRWYFVAAIAASSARTLDELALARALLHDKIYRHQKVRGAEVMVASALRLLSEGRDYVPTLPLKFADEAFLDLTQEDISTLTLDNESASVVADLIARLRRRQLFVRGFVWSTVPDAVGYTTKDEQTEGFGELSLAAGNANRRAKLVEDIAVTVTQMAKLAKRDTHLKPFGRLSSYIGIDPPRPVKGRSLLRRAYLWQSDGTLRRFRDEYPDTEGWTDQYLVNREIGYVFCPREIEDLVYLATELVFRQQFNIRQPSAFGVESKIDADPLREILFTSGFYEGKPHDLRPMPRCLTVVSAAARIDRIVREASEYTPPIANEDEAENSQPLKIDAATIKDFLRQFTTDREAELGLEMLEAVQFVKRRDIVKTIADFLRNQDSLNTATVVSLGTAKDSGSIVGYYAADVVEDNDISVHHISEIPEGVSHIVFVDDFIGSGRQTIDILETWLGIPNTGDLGEDRGHTELPACLPDRLREAELSFVYCAGLEEGRRKLMDRTAQLELNVRNIHIQHSQDAIPHAFGNDLTANDLTSIIKDNDMRNRCDEIGQKLLRSSRRYDETQIKDRALGYGGKSLLLVLPYNTPAQSLTLLWERGEVDGIEWRPLFPRRRKT